MLRLFVEQDDFDLVFHSDTKRRELTGIISILGSSLNDASPIKINIQL